MRIEAPPRSPHGKRCQLSETADVRAGTSRRTVPGNCRWAWIMIIHPTSEDHGDIE